MQKIVFNDCFGGFSLSARGAHELLKRRPDLAPDLCEEYGQLPRNFSRADADLVAVVEQLGAAASGRNASLCICELPNNMPFVIEEYDGLETVEIDYRAVCQQALDDMTKGKSFAAESFLRDALAQRR